MLSIIICPNSISLVYLNHYCLLGEIDGLEFQNGFQDLKNYYIKLIHTLRFESITNFLADLMMSKAIVHRMAVFRCRIFPSTRREYIPNRITNNLLGYFLYQEKYRIKLEFSTHIFVEVLWILLIHYSFSNHYITMLGNRSVLTFYKVFLYCYLQFVHW